MAEYLKRSKKLLKQMAKDFKDSGREAKAVSAAKALPQYFKVTKKGKINRLETVRLSRSLLK